MPRLSHSMTLPSMRLGILSVAILAMAACSSGDKADSAAAKPALPEPGTPSSMSGTAMGSADSMPAMKAATGMPAMKDMATTGDADHDFLRMMSDHHKGMILMAHMTKDRKGGEDGHTSHQDQSSHAGRTQ